MMRNTMITVKKNLIATSILEKTAQLSLTFTATQERGVAEEEQAALPGKGQ